MRDCPGIPDTEIDWATVGRKPDSKLFIGYRDLGHHLNAGLLGQEVAQALDGRAAQIVLSAT